MNHVKRPFSTQLLALVGALGLTHFVQGQILTPLHYFNAITGSTNSDGKTPSAPLVEGPDGNFYGTTENGGANGTGTIFKVTPGGVFSTLHTFSVTKSTTNADGAFPVAALIVGADSSLYGTAAGAGAYGNYGTVFRITTNGDFTTLHSFNYSDGENPSAPLALAADGNYYGTAALGGGNQNGSIFRISPDGTFQSLYDFSPALPTQAFYANLDGSRPYGLTLGRDGMFYGTTEFGGTNGNGTLFQFNTGGSIFRVLHTFSPQDTHTGANADGAAPQSPLVQGSDGNFYGTTPNGGAKSGGTLFQISPDGVFKTIHSFDYFAEGYSAGPIMTYGGLLYGTTGSGSAGPGFIFQCPYGGDVTVLYTFSALDASSHNSDGAGPYQGVVRGSDGGFYGTTLQGGTNGNGVVFRLDLPKLTIAELPGQKVLVSWPANQPGFSLQSTTNLANSSWTPALPPPAVVGNYSVVTNSMAGPAAFYRLIK
jgi:uncharacterized repeat protein (TIGR03803 family)